MATPPPEATSFFKEKSQLHPTLTDIPLDSTVNGSQSRFLQAVTSGKSTETIDDMAVSVNKDISPAVNGHGAGQSPLTNGVSSTLENGQTVTTTSSPKSPVGDAQAVRDPPSFQVVATQAATTSSVSESPDIALRVNLPSSRQGKDADDSASKFEHCSEGSDVSPQLGVEVVGGKNATEQLSQSPVPTSSTKTQETTGAAHQELPYSEPDGNKDGLINNSPARSTRGPIDHDMPDVTTPPIKVQRERELDPDDEPIPKRTKRNGDASDVAEFKVPNLPSSNFVAVVAPAESELAMTKLQHKFLAKALAGLKRVHDARYFKEPVDVVKLNIPNYPLIVTQPMDLATIEKKLKSDQYSSVQFLIDDFNLMVKNALAFNGAEHLVTQEGMKLKAAFEKQLTNLPKPDEVEEKKPKKAASTAPRASTARRESRASGGQTTARPNATSPQSTTFALGPEGLPLIRRDSSNADGRPKRSIHPPKRDIPYAAKPKKKKYQWELRFCEDVLDELHKPKYVSIAAPFYVPVDPVALNIPTYHNIIKKPMDLSTVRAKLKAGQYENAKEMEIDMRQIFKNCYKFNIPGDPTYISGKKLEDAFDTKWALKARWLEAHDPASGHHSAGSSDEESNEDAEDSDDDADQEKLTMLRKQIDEMSKQVEAITQKAKKKTPPTSKKSAKTKLGKKEPKKALVKKDKKNSSKNSKSEKQRWVTYQEKQIISNGISSLPDKKMQEALKIIQNNVPHLKSTQETEIELDIDELPNKVLVTLLEFVKKNVPHVLEEHEAAPAPVVTAIPSKPKKNKPMSKYEQEAQINMIEGSLSRFQGATARSPEPMPSVETNAESSDEEDDSEESEEE